MGISVSISVALLVVVAGMFLLAKTKKEELGNMFSFVSYSVITIGMIVLLCAFVCGICEMTCSGCYGSKKGCYSGKLYSGCSGATSCASYRQGCSKSGCSASSKCSKATSCSKKKCCKGNRDCKKGKESKGDDEKESVDVKIEISE